VEDENHLMRRGKAKGKGAESVMGDAIGTCSLSEKKKQKLKGMTCQRGKLQVLLL